MRANKLFKYLYFVILLIITEYSQLRVLGSPIWILERLNETILGVTTSRVVLCVTISCVVLWVIMLTYYRTYGKMMAFVPLVAFCAFVSAGVMWQASPYTIITYHIFTVTFINTVGLVVYDIIMVRLGKPTLYNKGGL